ncbi:NADPH-dependent ferric siderophore reductase [Agromyces terreus]|uniref:NADPH-dependent ferric siderophore reductase n=1 Tax=Agromyces terreus TaxID=424795 RepID=A0A9X2GZJ1_9MICO|nr:SIP domain-containing protein [Agromyces terreus]MCP2369828.1 NADPH-dependent ferric siderophore reductase [Agromyces terreus]
MVSRMRPRSQPGPVMLFAGDTGDIAAIRSRLADCAPNATGIVLIEAFNAMQIVQLEAPAGIAVHWVFRENRRGALAARGETLVAAVDAWLDEWMRPEGGAEIAIWLGARTSAPVGAFAQALERELAAAR